MPSQQFFRRGGKWISREQLLAARQVEAEDSEAKTNIEDAATGAKKWFADELKDMSAEELVPIYETTYGKEIAPAYKNRKEWIISKIISYAELQ